MNNRRVLLKSYVWGHIVSNRLASLLNSIKGRFKNLTLLGNSVQGENPSPDNPQEIKSVGRKSKNLFNAEALIVGQVQTDGTINEKATTYRTVILDVPEDGKYRITYDSNSDYSMLYFTELYVNGTYSHPYVKAFAGNSNILLTLAKGKNIVSFSTHKESERINFTKDYNIMIAAESASLVYEPYRNKYLLDVKVTGKNLIPNTVGFEVGSFNYNTGVNMILPDRGRLKEYIPIAPGKKYLVTVNGNTSIDDIGVHFLDIDRFPVAGHGTTRFISPPNAYYVRIRYKGWTENDKVSLQLQDASLDYEPYTEQSVQIALDEPLRGIGEYKDTITKDGVIRKIKRIVFDENTPFKEYNAPVQVKTTSFISGTTIKDATSETGIEVMSDRFKAKDRGFDRYDEECITLFGRSIFVRFNKDKNINTEEALTEWLKQNPLTVDYVLAEPITEPLPESVQQQLQALHSENGTTHVFVDSGEVEAGISVTYKQKK